MKLRLPFALLTALLAGMMNHGTAYADTDDEAGDDAGNVIQGETLDINEDSSIVDTTLSFTTVKVADGVTLTMADTILKNATIEVAKTLWMTGDVQVRDTYADPGTTISGAGKLVVDQTFDAITLKDVAIRTDMDAAGENAKVLMTGAFTLGDGTKAGTATIRHWELGASDKYPSTNVTVEKNYTVRVTGGEEDLLFAQNGTTDLRVYGTLLAKNASLDIGEKESMVYLEGGTLAVKGISGGGYAKFSMQEGSTLVLGEDGLDLSAGLSSGTLATFAQGTTISGATLGNLVIDTNRYSISESGVTRGQEGSVIRLADGTKGTSGATLTKTGSGTLVIDTTAGSDWLGNVSIEEGRMQVETGKWLLASRWEVKSGATLVFNGDNEWRNSIIFESGATLQVQDGTFSLTNGTIAADNIVLGKEEEETVAAIAVGQNCIVASGIGTYTGRESGGSISASGGKSISVTDAGVSFDNLDITLDTADACNVVAGIENSNLTLNGGATYTLKEYSLGTLTVGADTTAIVTAGTYSGALKGEGSIIKQGAGTLSATELWCAAKVEDGTLSLSSTISGSKVDVSQGGVLELHGQASGSVNIQEGASLVYDGNNISLTGNTSFAAGSTMVVRGGANVTTSCDLDLTNVNMVLGTEGSDESAWLTFSNNRTLTTGIGVFSDKMEDAEDRITVRISGTGGKAFSVSNEGAVIYGASIVLDTDSTCEFNAGTGVLYYWENSKRYEVYPDLTLQGGGTYNLNSGIRLDNLAVKGGSTANVKAGIAVDNVSIAQGSQVAIAQNAQLQVGTNSKKEGVSGTMAITAKVSETEETAPVAAYSLVSFGDSTPNGTEITPDARLTNVSLNESGISGAGTEVSGISDANITFDNASVSIEDLSMSNTSVSVGNGSTLTMNNVNLVNGAGINIASGSELVVGENGIRFDVSDPVDVTISDGTATLDLSGILGGAGVVTGLGTGAGAITFGGLGIASTFAGLGAGVTAVVAGFGALVATVTLVFEWGDNGESSNTDDPSKPIPWPPPATGSRRSWESARAGHGCTLHHGLGGPCCAPPPQGVPLKYRMIEQPAVFY